MTGDFGGAAKKLLVNELENDYLSLTFAAYGVLAWLVLHVLSYICPCIACSPWQVYPFIRGCPDPAKTCPIPEEMTGMSPVLMIQWSCLSLVRARAEMTRLRHRNPVNGQYHIPTPTGWLTPMRCNKRNL